MTERKGITVMMLGFIIGIVLLVVVVVFILMFYEGDLFGGILKGLGDMIRGFTGGGGSTGGVGSQGSW